MKISDPKYIQVHPEDVSRFSHDFNDFVDIPTKSEYTLIPIGSYGGSNIYDIYDKIVVFYTELPNALSYRNDDSEFKKFISQNNFYKILTDCQFSVDYFNQYVPNRFEKVFLPINPKYIPEQTEKCFDVYYTGHYFNSPIKFIFRTLDEKFKFCSVGRDHGKYSNCSYKQKLFLNAKSKISIVHGLLEWNLQDRSSAKNYFQGHKAFDLVEQYGIVPQIKSRTLEAAMSKSLILNYKDPWNLIELYFEKDEFIYWTDLKDLEEKINHIISHYDDYIPMIEKAYNRVISNYTNKIFFEKFLKNI